MPVDVIPVAALDNDNGVAGSGNTASSGDAREATANDYSASSKRP